VLEEATRILEEARHDDEWKFIKEMEGKDNEIQALTKEVSDVNNKYRK
jgi:polyhydroxyalkanoate synthesis regulator phasin